MCPAIVGCKKVKNEEKRKKRKNEKKFSSAQSKLVLLLLTSLYICHLRQLAAVVSMLPCLKGVERQHIMQLF